MCLTPFARVCLLSSSVSLMLCPITCAEDNTERAEQIRTEVHAAQTQQHRQGKQHEQGQQAQHQEQSQHQEPVQHPTQTQSQHQEQEKHPAQDQQQLQDQHREQEQHRQHTEQDQYPYQSEHSDQTEHTDNFRIKRDYSPRLYGSVQHSSRLPISHTYQPMQAQSAPVQMAPPAQFQPNDYATAVNTYVPPPSNFRPPSNYIWGQSAVNGYYDATGQIKGLVPGDQLFRYGGTFMDGSAVPTTPVVCNFAGHVYSPYIVKR